MNAQHGFAVICALVLAGGSASGESIIHDASNFSFAGSSISSLVLANDFQVASATSPASASAWLIETTPDIPGVFEGFSGTLGWAIYASAGSFPSTMPLAVGSDASPVLTDVGDDLGGQDVFRADIDLVDSLSSGSLALGPGTYWFALHEGNYFSPDDGSEIRWLLSLDGVTGTRARFELNETAPGTAWMDIGVDNDYAFRLTAVPEPSAAALAAGGAIGLLALGRRRRQRRVSRD